MKYGLALPNAGPDARTLVELAVQAEQAGWDGVFLEDYIVWQGHQEVATYDPWALLSAMAMVTQHIRLGTQVTPLARRRPWVVAKQAATLDGYDVSVGGGIRRADWEEERVYIQSLAEAGATWWIEYADPEEGLAAMRLAAGREPLRIEP